MAADVSPKTPAIVVAIVAAAAAADADSAAAAAAADAAIAAAAPFFSASSRIIICKNCGCVFSLTSFHGFRLLHACCYSDIIPELLSSSNFGSKSASRNSIGTTP